MSIRDEQCRKVCRILDDVLANRPTERDALCVAVDKAFEALIQSEQQRTGKWIRHNTYHGDNTSGYVDPDWRCSKCGKSAMVNEWMLCDLSNFCPNCGAKMTEGDAE